MITRNFIALLVLYTCVFGLQAQSGNQTQATETAKRVQALLDSDDRSDEARESDRTRRPVQSLDFFGLDTGMKVIEFVPAGGYYTEILAHALNGNGELLLLGYGADNARQYQDKGMQHVKAIAANTIVMAPTSQQGIFDLQKIDVPVTDADMFLTFRNVHNISEATRPAMHAAVFNMLKPGGVYGIIDHTKRHNEPFNPETWRRVDPVRIIKEVVSAGFVFEDYSDLHYRADDELMYDTTRPAVDRYSDRFTLRFRKP